jgi:hypothetical protein
VSGPFGSTPHVGLDRHMPTAPPNESLPVAARQATTPQAYPLMDIRRNGKASHDCSLRRIDAVTDTQ